LRQRKRRLPIKTKQQRVVYLNDLERQAVLMTIAAGLASAR
jgi:hypothetical protein